MIFLYQFASIPIALVQISGPNLHHLNTKAVLTYYCNWQRTFYL